MNLDLLREKLPDVESWVFRTVSTHAKQAQAAASFSFPRLGSYYPPAFLQAANVVVTPAVPIPPLSSMGLVGFEDFEGLNAAGITFMDTYFIRSGCHDDESLHFHELVHVAQWRHLGPTNFILGYALGHILDGGYAGNPFERSAYALQAKFDAGGEVFDADVLARADAEREFWRLVIKAGLGS